MMELMKYHELAEDKRGDKEYRILQQIKVQELQDMVVDILNEYSNSKKLENANQVGDLVVFLLKERGLIREGVHQSFVDLLLSSCLLYNIVKVEKENWEDVYMIRKIIYNVSMEYKTIPDQALETICDVIEGQLGESMPIKGSRPNPNTPGELFATAVAIVNKYL